MSENQWPQIQPSADAQATGFAIAYAIFQQLPEDKREKEPKEIARQIGTLADIIIKRGVVSIRRS